MKICFFSDIHGNIYSLNSFIEVTVKQDIDMFIFGGDFFGYYYYANDCIDKIRSLPNCRSVLGNHDQYFLDLLHGNLTEDVLITKYGNSYSDIVSKISQDNINFVGSLPTSLEMLLDDKKIAFFHGSPNGSAVDRVYPDTDLSLVESGNYDVCFLGHTHHKMIRYKDNTLIINPGSVGQQRDGKGVSYIIYDTSRHKCDFFTFEYDKRKLLDDIDFYDGYDCRFKEVILRKS